MKRPSAEPCEVRAGLVPGGRAVDLEAVIVNVIADERANFAHSSPPQHNDVQNNTFARPARVSQVHQGSVSEALAAVVERHRSTP